MLLGKSKKKVSARKQIRIKEVKENVLVLPGNKYRMVLETSAINFELKSEEEKDAIIDNFQNFLNSLPSYIQILIRVREVDIDKYLENFSKKQDTEVQEVYKGQISSYCEFIQSLVSDNKILSRKFYIVIPYDVTDGNNDFALIKHQLLIRLDIIIKGLEKLGMKTKILDSLQILELFYVFYNPDQTKSLPLNDDIFPELSEGKPYAII